ncbi:exodeoxyribonuclease V subunit beta [Comamonas antarctica]|uniref:exodeoxyribonuclease V subunit beta n=1 Tax=Comamonas antarctica TaxID=2743470 RepID=UPI0028E4F868|nr:exodeoxyribonuclease V subunit beta [Comamonas antarctica]
MSHVLNARDFPLWGSRLIEASAGTGKTWTIAALYLRLVLGHGGANAHPRALLPAEILVMTFTRAATRELSDRIRARLTEAVQCFRGEREPEAHDQLLQALLADHPEGQARTQAAWRLAMAAEAMDDAAVFTIDAWCQRMLREHAFDSGNLFDEELAADEEQLRREAVQDYWRQQCYPLDGAALETVLGVWSGLDALLQDMRTLLDQPVDPEAGAGTLAQSVQAAQDERAGALTTLAQGWGAQAQALRDWLDAQVAESGAHWDGRKLAPRHYTGWLQSVIDWADDPLQVELALTDSARHRLSPDGLLEARKKGAPSVALPPGFAALQQLLADLAKLPVLGSRLRLHAAARVLERLAQLKRQQGTFGFADLLQRLDRALAGENGAALCARIKAQYPVALIDEFQDTSPLQYRLFERIYGTADNDPATALLLIGDPKQSIYGFRGADIYSYLQARHATTGRHYVLDTNYRSTQALVDAVNHWFGQAEQRDGAGAFMFRKPGEADNPLPFEPVRAQGRKEAFRDVHGPVPALQLQVELDPMQTAKRAQRGFAARCAEQIVQWLNDPEAGFAAPDKPFARLRPADIAVLVRTGSEARSVRRELGARGVASVYLSDNESVFAGSEAQDLVLWLNAVAAPRDARAVRAGLATRLLGLSLDELGWLAADDEAFDARCDQLRGLQAVWQSQGVLAMLRQTLHQFDLPARWLMETGGERRLTNYLHLAELLQTASAQLEGEHALIRWLGMQCAGEGSHSDEQIVRLESDADLVKVVTVHKSKGLEYPVVFLPFACSYREINRRMDRFVSLPRPEGGRVLRLDYDDAELALADTERLREDLRLLYVALTRARHALWLGVPMLQAARSKASTTLNHRSATGYTLAGTQECTPEDWHERLDALVAGQPGLQWQAVHGAPARSLLQARAAPPPLLDAPAYGAQFDRRWGIGSFSSLVRALAAPSLPVSPVPQEQPADDERPIGADLAVAAAPAAPAKAAVWHRFMKGPVIGNWIHDELEWLAGEDFALEADGSGALAQRLLQRSERAGRAAQAADLVQWLAAVVHHPLAPLGVPLSALEQRLPEMEFWLPAQRLPAPDIDRLCQQHLLAGVPRPYLPERQLHGMLMGFADLVFAHEGRYWVLDYKTNYLGRDAAAYDERALCEAMAAHRYDVQAALYLLALHRLLQSRLGDAYDPRQQLGGALYFFVRGIDGPAQGMHVVPPSLPLLEALGALLDARDPEMEAELP